MKQTWMDTMAHLHAQDAILFLMVMLGVLLLSGWLEWRRG